MNIFLSISLNIGFAFLKNQVIETILLSAHSICFGYKLQILILIFVLLKLDVSFFENTVDSDQLIEKIAEVNIGIQWWISK